MVCFSPKRVAVVGVHEPPLREVHRRPRTVILRVLTLSRVAVPGLGWARYWRRVVCADLVYRVWYVGGLVTQTGGCLVGCVWLVVGVVGSSRGLLLG